MVQPGDTLLRIAQRTGVTVTELRQANCLGNDAHLFPDQVIYVPGRAVGLSVTESVTYAGLERLEGCSNPGVQITRPQPGERIEAITTIYGTASTTAFQYYRLEIRADAAAVYDFLLQSDEPVRSGALGLLNPVLMRQGVYWIRLSVIDVSGAIVPETCAIPVIIE